MNLDTAIQAHAQWKMKLRSAISRCEAVDAASIGADNCCELGRWMHGEGRIALGRSPVFNECLSLHAAFHREAGRVANAINARRYEEAEAMLNSGTAYSEASSAVGAGLIRLKREAAQAA
ncbi:MAG TPA: CZB domain-containing protein [Caulobacter sp.]|nr:CZB domain-containing protein [Caulobacter sp.]